MPKLARQGTLAACVAIVALVGCSSPSGGTRIALSVTYDDALGVTQLGVDVDGTTRTVPAAHALTLLVADDSAGHAQIVRVDGLRGTMRVASGITQVTPVRGEVTAGAVTLARVACGAWCVTGATDCRGGGVVVCEQRDDDPCLEWSLPVACPAEAPYCSLGRCAATCTDECVMGEKRCDGDSVRVCGQDDTDSCLEWLAPVACGVAEQCTDGTCAARCHDECASAATTCRGAGTATCGDLDADGCTEWGPVTPCGATESCALNRCVPAVACTDECTTSQCDGLAFRTCGNFDLDPCRELSGGATCTAMDRCEQATCDPTAGCGSASVECVPDAGSPDAGAPERDAGVDAGMDSGTDAGADAGHDSGTDAGADAGHDSGTDAGRDAGRDAGHDAGNDADLLDCVPLNGFCIRATDCCDFPSFICESARCVP